jgi:hypothetical protein
MQKNNKVAQSFLGLIVIVYVSFVVGIKIGYNDLHASDGRDTEALNCKPITNLKKKCELPN